MSRALAAIALCVALAGCGDRTTSLKKFCADHGGGPGPDVVTLPGDQGADVVCGDHRLRRVDGPVKP
jgi:hypothetical protein